MRVLAFILSTVLLNNAVFSQKTSERSHVDYEREEVSFRFPQLLKYSTEVFPVTDRIWKSDEEEDQSIMVDEIIEQHPLRLYRISVDSLNEMEILYRRPNYHRVYKESDSNFHVFRLFLIKVDTNEENTMYWFMGYHHDNSGDSFFFSRRFEVILMLKMEKDTARTVFIFRPIDPDVSYALDPAEKQLISFKNICCCKNHQPRHCCKKLSEMARGSKVQHCSF